MRGSHAWLDARDLTAGTQLTNRAKHRLTGSVQYEIIPAQLTGLLSVEYNGKQFIRVGTPPVDSSLPAYTLVNISLRWNMTEHQIISFGVQNLTNVDLIEKSPNFSYAERGRSYFARWTMGF